MLTLDAALRRNDQLMLGASRRRVELTLGAERSANAERDLNGAGSSEGFWSTQDPVIEGTGDKKLIRVGGMFAAQRAWWNLPNKIKLLLGGYGAGKTLICCKRAIASALQNAPAPTAIVSPTYAMSRDTVLETLTELLDGKAAWLPSLRWNYNQSTRRVTIRYQGRVATIILYSGENPKRLKGPNIGSAYIDEPFIQDEEVFTQILARVRHPEAEVLEIGLTGTPEGVLSWGRDMVEGEDRDKLDLGFVRASSSGNFALPDSYVRDLRRKYDAKMVEAYLEGRFVNLSGGRIYHTFSSDNVAPIGYRPGMTLGVGMDFNVDPMTAVVFQYDKKRLHFLKEYSLPNSDTELMASKLLEDWGELGLREVYPDPAGKARSTNAPAGRSDHDILRLFGFEIHAHNKHPAVRDRYNAANAMFRASTGRIRMTVEPKQSDVVQRGVPELGCPDLIKHFEAYTEENRGKTLGRAMSHLTDAATYPVEFLFPITRRSLEKIKLHVG